MKENHITALKNILTDAVTNKDLHLLDFANGYFTALCNSGYYDEFTVELFTISLTLFDLYIRSLSKMSEQDELTMIDELIEVL